MPVVKGLVHKCKLNLLIFNLDKVLYCFVCLLFAMPVDNLCKTVDNLSRFWRAILNLRFRI